MFRDFAVEMANRGHRVDIVCHQLDDFWACKNDLLIVHGISPVVRLEHGHFPSLFQQISYILKLVIKGAQIIRQNKIDIIHANTLSPAFAGSILGKLYNIPVINTIHHVYSLKNNEYTSRRHRKNRFLSWLFSLPKFLCEKTIVRLPADGIHTVSNSSKDDLVRFGLKDCAKITVVPNAVDLIRLDACNNKIHDIQYGDFALFIGRLVEYKNLDVIITAFREVVNAVPHARLVIAGDGPARQKWKEIASSNGLSGNIEFQGYVSEERKEELLRNCSMLVFPSLIEGFGLAIVEAFAHNKPVIVSDVRPLTEIVDDDVDGFTLPSSSPSDWAEKIVFLLKNKSIREAMGAKGRNKAETKFNIIYAAENLESMYKELIGKQNHRLQELEVTL